MTDLLLAITLICKVYNGSGRNVTIQNTQRVCVAQIWDCIQESEEKIGKKIGQCIKPKKRKRKRKN